MSRSFLFILLMSFLVQSCRELVTNSFDDFENAITLNAYMAADSIITINVSQTQKMGGDVIEYLEDAQVKLLVNDSLLEQPYLANGNYSAGHKAQSGHTYYCEVIYNDECASATCQIPQSPDLREVQLYPEGWLNDEGMPSPLFELTIGNTPGDTVYYETFVYGLFKNIYGNDAHWYIGEEQSVDLFSNLNERDSTFIHQAEFSHYSYGSNTTCAYIIELRALSKDAYQYLYSYDLYELGRYPEFGAGAVVPYNIYNNVDNGYGIFAGYSAVLSDTLYE